MAAGRLPDSDGARAVRVALQLSMMPFIIVGCIVIMGINPPVGQITPFIFFMSYTASLSDIWWLKYIASTAALAMIVYIAILLDQIPMLVQNLLSYFIAGTGYEDLLSMIIRPAIHIDEIEMAL